MIEFEWDEAKADANFKKHGVSFDEAASVFGDALAVTFADPDHSAGERRFLTFGLSRERRLLVVSHTERRNCIRIISSRCLTRKERNIYEEG